MSEAGKEYGELVKQRREQRQEKFLDFLMPKMLKRGYEVLQNSDSSFEFEDVEFGRIKFYPKADRILICQQNKWHYSGYLWIKKHILNQR